MEEIVCMDSLLFEIKSVYVHFYFMFYIHHKRYLPEQRIYMQ